MKRAAFFNFASCGGCHLTVIDSLQTHVDLLDVIEIIQFPQIMAEKGQDYAIAFVEGSLSRASDEACLRQIRAQAETLVALGACAHLGGVNAIRNAQPLEDARRYVYGDRFEWFEAYPARPLSAVVEVDAFIPGCPIDRDEFLNVVKALLRGVKPPIPDYPLCVECKLKENVCLFHKGGYCLGPVTRAGCGAICPTYGAGCAGCRGLIPQPNEHSMSDVLVKHSLTVDDMLAQWTMFGTYQQMEAQKA